MSCIRCGSKKNLEKDHIIPKSRGGSDEESNKRWLCVACHDYRHARDNVIRGVNTQLLLLGTPYYNSVKVSMWIMRLGVLEAFNTPERIKKSGRYTSYWSIPETHGSAWYPQIKLAKLNRIEREKKRQKLQTTLLEN